MSQTIPKSKPGKKNGLLDILNSAKPPETGPSVIPPIRAHTPGYHYPLLLSDEKCGAELLKWFDSVKDDRGMPWRKDWIDASIYEGDEDALGKMLAQRAYEIWVSEIMCQQTRVGIAIPYFNTWMAKWPSIEALSAAKHEEVLSVWKGLGYYSRATRLHQGAQTVVQKAGDQSSPIPSTSEDLQKIPGIGRYTAGAISSIAFGKAVAVLDGNVARVLSRQIGLYVDVKEKEKDEILWEVAEKIIHRVSGHGADTSSSIPGRWNQAFMELGAVICTPGQPKCAKCPIRRTCRTYAEGSALLESGEVSLHAPILDTYCSYCTDIDLEDLQLLVEVEDDLKSGTREQKRKRKREPKVVISRHFSSSSSTTGAGSPSQEFSNLNRKLTALKDNGSPSAEETFTSKYCSLFPRTVSRKRRLEECVVCIIEMRDENDSEDGRWLIEQRPAKGLLASLWQFPLADLTPTEATEGSYQSAIDRCLATLGIGDQGTITVGHPIKLGSLIHEFTHIKLTMHVYSIILKTTRAEIPKSSGGPVLAQKWVSSAAMHKETLSTGMRKCWELFSDQRSSWG